jgi:predicted SAM-dependent methyltransferase
MLTRFAKATFYAVAGPLMWANGRLYRSLRAPQSGIQRVHLGPGQRNYLPGWINVDANMFTAKCDIWTDFSSSLPFRDNSIDALYSHHVIEHLPDLDRHFREAYRCLKPGGVYRVGGPNADSAIRKFLDNDRSWFKDWPEQRQSIGGKLNNFLLCRNEHLAILTKSFLFELMESAGFRQIETRLPKRETGWPDLFRSCLEREREDDSASPRTLFVEGAK